MGSTADVGLRIVDCDEGRVAALRSFFARVYRADYALCDTGLLRWQFQRMPGSDGRRWYIKLAVDEAGIAGCLGYIPLEIAVRGRIVQGAWVVNWMVDPGRRQLGLGPLLMREVMRQFEVTLNIGPNETARAMLSRMGWQSYGELPRYVAVLDRVAAAAVTEAGQLAIPVSGTAAVGAASEATGRVVRVERFDAQATKLWDRLSGMAQDGIVGSRRSAEFLNWRYGYHPHFRYRLFSHYKNGQMAGLAVYRIEAVQGMPIRVGRLVEYLDTAEDEGLSPLLTHVLQDARDADVALVDFFCTDRRLAPRLERHGFTADASVTSNVPSVFQPIDRRRTGMAFMAHGTALGVDPPQWYVTKGDGDQDRPN